MSLSIAIIGAGIIGLTSAIRILDNRPDAKIKIFYKDKSPNTVSDVSAGYWEPFCMNEKQKGLLLKWGRETYETMLATSLSDDNCGIQPISAYKIQNSETLKIPFWSDIVSQFRELGTDDMSSVCSTKNLDAKSGYHFITLTVNVSKYINILMKKLANQGVEFVQKELTNLTEFLEENQNCFNYVINCTGLGAREFCNDSNMVPVKGQLVKIEAPWIKNCLMLEYELTYILPIDDCVFLGGTFNYDLDDSNSNEDDCEQIIKRCSKLIPSLKNARVIEKIAGRRPFRKNGIRLELETHPNGKVIHNYGHSGSGFTLCWGCATTVYELLETDLRAITSIQA